MTAKVVFFPVGNGDMTLIELSDGKKILIDCNIRAGDEYPDVTKMLRDRLTKDSAGRLYVDVFIWTHPDEDHCRGIESAFHLGRPDEWTDKKDLIFINEIWSSPRVFKRANKTNNILCDSAKKLNKEIKKRVNLYKERGYFENGDYVAILGHDDGDKTEDITEIVVELDATHAKVNDSPAFNYEIVLLGPCDEMEFDEDEEEIGKNHSSVIINHKISVGSSSYQFLTGGDAGVACWEALYKRLKGGNKVERLEYDLMQASHHCSWHSLSRDSLSDLGDKAKTSDDAIAAMSEANDSAIIVASSIKIENDDNPPPALSAKKEYQKILKEPKGTFKCVDDHKKGGKNVPLEIEFSDDEMKALPVKGIGRSQNSKNSSVNRVGSDGYA